MPSVTERYDEKSNSYKCVLNTIRRNYPVSRNDIAKLTGLSIPSISRILPKLFSEGYLEELETESVGLGRKTKLITLKEASVFTVGAEYDGERLKVAVVDARSEIVSFGSYEVEKLEPKELCSMIQHKIEALLLQKQLNRKQLVGIGVAMPGIIDYEKGTVLFSAQLGWRNVAITQTLKDMMGVNCVLDNDIKAAAYAEYRKGNASDSKIAVSLYFGSGLGSAAIIDGKIFRGVSNSAGELGHITHDISGTMCSCGKIGCLQTNIAKGFLLQEARKVSQLNAIDELFDPDIRKEKWAERIVSRFVTYAAMSIDTVVCAFNPDTVILAGDMICNKQNNLYKEIYDTYYENFLVEYLKDTFSIKLSAFNGKGSAAGAGMLAADAYFHSVKM